MAIILGVDPGLTRCGFAVIDAAKTEALDFGMYQSLPSSDARDRVCAIASEL
jgi:Holliday junction resolvasome RuvABC endonuclease subunit